MTDWPEIYETDCALPPGRPLDDLVAELAAALGDPDPAVRDGHPYAVLETWIARGVIDRDRRLALGDLMAARLTDPRVQARTFAPLVLTMIVGRGDLRPAWVEAFTAWYRSETDLRGHDAALGWLHAVAHGADLLAALGRRPEVDPEPLLALAAERLVTPTDHLFAQREDDRLAKALAFVLTRADLTAERSTAWLSPVGAALAAREGGPLPFWVSNTVRTLRALYVVADVGVSARRGEPRTPLTHAEAVKSRLAEVSDQVFPYLP
ncbi:DUF2785 domain-containing protein [Kitasatospora sp. NPDC004745]|uniref:DUF2785 domain-containing protein n=1 Tax=Kitasatospora sp. NPDC004745 TaxID=3364019 RepID=UPI00367CD9E2